MQEAEQITLGDMPRDENAADSNLVRVLLEDELGYENVGLKASGTVPQVFEGVAAEKADVFMDAWMPNHRQYVDKTGVRVEAYREPWYVGETEFGAAVPLHVKGIKTIRDRKFSEPGMITGIATSAVLIGKTSKNAVPRYDLEFSVAGASPPAMLIELQKSYTMEEPSVFVAWSPRWMNQEYGFRYLEDPKNTLGTPDDPQTLHTVAQEGFSEDDPAAHALINAMRLDEEQMGSLEVAINDATDPKMEAERGARDWLDDPANREVVRPWIQAARRTEEG